MVTSNETEAFSLFCSMSHLTEGTISQYERGMELSWRTVVPGTYVGLKAIQEQIAPIPHSRVTGEGRG